MKLIDNLGIKNFRIFDDHEGFFEEISSINILTGANNSGKSTIIKLLQMLKNSVQSGLPVFDLDLTNQEHLLGDFDTILFNKSNRTVDIAIPFTFLGLSYFYASLSFEAQKAPNNYKAKLKGIEILDDRDKSLLFSFNFRNASENEINNHSQKFEENKKRDEKKKKEKAQNIGNDFLSTLTQFNFTLPYDALFGFVEWTINFEKLKKELDVVKEFYTLYINNNSEFWLDKTDEKAEEKNLPFVPSLLIKPFKKKVTIAEWDIFTASLSSGVLNGKKEVCESDYEVDDFEPIPTDQEILYYKSLEILRENIKWISDENENKSYNVIEHFFRTAWNGLIQRISTLSYLSPIKEQNARIYNASADSHFINLLKDFNRLGLQKSSFLKKYLQKFEIGNSIEIDYQPKYQLISVNITTLDGTKKRISRFWLWHQAINLNFDSNFCTGRKK